jgi:HSP20 family protein
MSNIKVRSVHTAEDRSLPIFAEFDKIADRIRERAYSMFRERGLGDGSQLDDWLCAERQICWPAAELEEDSDEFHLKLAMAGFEPKEISVTATPHEIFVKAGHESRHEDGDGEDSRVRWSEFQSNEVFRHFDLPIDVNVDDISAKYTNGMLKIDAPKVAEKARSRKVEVKKAS